MKIENVFSLLKKMTLIIEENESLANENMNILLESKQILKELNNNSEFLFTENEYP